MCDFCLLSVQTEPFIERCHCQQVRRRRKASHSENTVINVLIGDNNEDVLEQH